MTDAAAGPAGVAKKVFISYTHRNSYGPATALSRELGPDVAFVDESDIGDGENFVDPLLDAILNAHVIVIFIDETYFERQYCWFEYSIATSAYEMLAARGVSEDQRAGALDQLVIVLPESDPGEVLKRLPLPLQERSWVRAQEPARLADLVRRRAERNGPLIDRLRELVDPDLRSLRSLLKEKNVPPSESVDRVRHCGPLPISCEEELVGRRHELWQIHQALTTNRSGAHRTVVVEGAVGVGKTNLAAEYLWRFGVHHYRGGVMWIQADGDDERLRDQFYDVLCQLGPRRPSRKAFNGLAMSEVARQVRDALAREARKGEPMLYVVDDVRNVSARGSRSFDAWCPAPESVSLLVTAGLQYDFDCAAEVVVDPLPAAQARALLLRGSGTAESLSVPEWDEITEWVGRLPLALKLLRPRLDEPKDLLAEARARVGPLAVLKRAESLSSVAVARGRITEAASLAYERLPDAARRGGRLIAQLSSQPIPRDLLKRLLAVLDPSLTVAEVREPLVERAFMSRAPGRGPVDVVGTMPPVLADFLRGQAEDPEADLALACDALTSVITAEACRDPAAWPLLDGCRPHGEEIFRRVEAQRGQYQPATRSRAVTVGLRVAALLRSQGRLAAAEERGRRILALADSVGGTGRQALAARSALAETVRAQGRLRDARRLQKELVALAEREPALGPDHPDTLSYRAQLAGTMAALGEGAEAARRLEAVVAVATATVGACHLDTLSYKQQLAVVLAANGKPRHASELQGDVVAQAASVLQPGHRFLLRSRANLAGMVGRLGRLEEARDLQAQVVEEASVLPESHPDRIEYQLLLAKILTALGSCRQDPDRWHESVNLQRTVLEVVTRAGHEADGGLDPDDALMAAGVRRDLGFTLQQLGDLEGAARELRLALKAFAPDGQRTGETLLAWNLFVVLEQLHDEARDVFDVHLRWLVEAEEASLDAEQRVVRDLLGEQSDAAPAVTSE